MAGRHPAAAGQGGRAARPDRALVPRAVPQRHPLPQAPGCARAATGAPATTPPWSWPPAPPASGSAPARSGACTSAGAGRGPLGRAQPRRPRRAGRGRAAGPRGGGPRPRPGLHLPAAAGRLQRRAWTAERGLPPLRARPAQPPAHAPAGRAQHLGGRLLRPPPGTADRAGRRGRPAGRRAVRARRRLVRQPARRHRRAGGLASPSTSGPTPRPADLPRPRAGHGVRALGRAGRWSTPTPTCSGPPRLGAVGVRRARPAARGLAPPAGARPGQPDRYAYPRPAGRPAQRPRHRLPEMGPQPRPDRGRPRRAARPARPGPWPSTGSWTSCADATPASRSRAALGGGRVDLGILAGPTGSGPADTNDALERQPIQRWTQLLVRPSWSAPRRPAAPSHHRPRPRLRLPGRHGAVRLLRHRVGHRLASAAASRRRWPRRSPSTGGCGRCSTAGRWCGPTTPTRPPTSTGWWPPTAPRRCSPTCSSPPGVRDARPGPAASGWTATAPTGSSRWRSPASPRPSRRWPRPG